MAAVFMTLCHSGAKSGESMNLGERANEYSKMMSAVSAENRLIRITTVPEP